jgi:hypothetical protein
MFVSVWCGNHLHSNVIDEGMGGLDEHYVDVVLPSLPSTAAADAAELHVSKPIETHRRELSCVFSVSTRRASP